MKIVILPLIALTLFLSCEKHEEEPVENEIVQVDEVPLDFIVPQVVWDSMAPHAEEGGEGGGEGEGGKGPEVKAKPILYASVKIFMKEKNKGVLKKPQMGFEFSRGGGEVDLSQVMGSQPGTFFVNFEMPEFENVLSQKIFLVSQSRQRKVDGEILGSGCRKVLDLSSGLGKVIKGEGLKINSTRSRHDSILGGHLIFMAETEKNWLMSQVTFFDSTRMDLFCKGFRTAGGY
jgi:hypothetical protein